MAMLALPIFDRLMVSAGIEDNWSEMLRDLLEIRAMAVNKDTLIAEVLEVIVNNMDREPDTDHHRSCMRDLINIIRDPYRFLGNYDTSVFERLVEGMMARTKVAPAGDTTNDPNTQSQGSQADDVDAVHANPVEDAIPDHGTSYVAPPPDSPEDRWASAAAAAPASPHKPKKPRHRAGRKRRKGKGKAPAPAPQTPPRPGPARDPLYSPIGWGDSPEPSEDWKERFGSLEVNFSTGSAPGDSLEAEPQSFW
ncbi:hypothetical protein F4776DRAFT_661982 [Hypoxylon sp. NC0597]|nr:hypothetical protein F4776DRAFT_661982 [Hypoxylon sp. NC0597]